MNSKLSTFLFNLIPVGNTILFESRPDFSDNTMAVFSEMIHRGLNKKYRLVWLIHNPASRPPELENVSAISYSDTRR